MVGLKEWLEATYIPSQEYCGVEVYTNRPLDYNRSSSEEITWWHGVRRPKIVCMDGFSVSVQGGYGIYSEPREYTKYYTKMEIGFPTHFDDPEFADNDGQVCGYLDVDDIQKVIERHGGINMVKTLTGYNYKNAQDCLCEIREKKIERILKDILK